MLHYTAAHIMFNFIIIIIIITFTYIVYYNNIML